MMSLAEEGSIPNRETPKVVWAILDSSTPYFDLTPYLNRRCFVVQYVFTILRTVHNLLRSTSPTACFSFDLTF